MGGEPLHWQASGQAYPLGPDDRASHGVCESPCEIRIFANRPMSGRGRQGFQDPGHVPQCPGRLCLLHPEAAFPAQVIAGGAFDFFLRRRAVLEQALYRHAQDLAQTEQHACADPIGAGFIFLELLVRDPQGTSEVCQGQASLQTEVSDILSDDPVGLLWSAGCVLEFSRRFRFCHLRRALRNYTFLCRVAYRQAEWTSSEMLWVVMGPVSDRSVYPAYFTYPSTWDNLSKINAIRDSSTRRLRQPGPPCRKPAPFVHGVSQFRHPRPPDQRPVKEKSGFLRSLWQRDVPGSRHRACRWPGAGSS